MRICVCKLRERHITYRYKILFKKIDFALPRVTLPGVNTIIKNEPDLT